MKRKELSIKSMVVALSDYYDISISDIVGKSRKEKFVDARQAISIHAGYIGYTEKEIKNVLNFKDESSINHYWNTRPVSDNAMKYYNYLKNINSNNKNISELALSLHKDVENREIREKLKELL